MATMTIGKLSKKTGVGIETIRFYEREGLILPPERRASSNYRQYDPGVVMRLSFIRRAKDLGFTLKEIKDLLHMQADTKRKCRLVKKKAKDKIEDINQKIVDLTKIKSVLEALEARCKEETISKDCPILQALNNWDLV